MELLRLNCASITTVLLGDGTWASGTTKNILKILFFVNRFTKRILVNSRSIKDVVVENEKFPANRIDVIYNGIDCFDIACSKEKCRCLKNFQQLKKVICIVGIVGNFNRTVKRFDLFIKSAAIVCAHRNSVKFLVIGGGKYERELKGAYI